MSLYSVDFIPWDAEEMAEKTFSKGGRLSDLHENEEFKKLLELAEAAGTAGNIYEIVGEVAKKYERALYNPENL